MTNQTGLRVRPAGLADAEDIAALHADSWRRHYRGAYSDLFLDGDVVADRLSTWRRRLERPDRPSWTVLALDGEDLVGFAHVVFEDDPTYGALLDNLHVTDARRRTGIGTRLFEEIAGAVASRGGSDALYLWVLEQNTAAQAFYEGKGGRCVERALVDPP